MDVAMHSRIVAFSTKITDDALHAFVVSELRGAWQLRHGLQQGTVEHGKAIVYVSVEPFDDLEPEEVEDLRERLAGPLRCLVAIQPGRAPGSAELAAGVLQRIGEKWGGIVFL